MSESQTPLTDEKVRQENPIGEWGDTSKISTDFARKLELANTQLRTENERLTREKDELKRHLNIALSKIPSMKPWKED